MTRYMRGMTNGGMISSRYGEPLTMEAIAAAVPSVFATEAHESRSERFAYIPTSTVLEGLKREGFEPFFAQQSATRIKGKESFTKHMLRLRHRSRTDAGGAAHEVILVNAHDGTAAYQMLSGVFRFVCANGLFAGDSFGEVKVRHTGDAVGQVIEGAYTVLEDAPRIMDGVDEMRATMLAEHERHAFAEAAHALRFPPKAGSSGNEEPEDAPVPAERMIRPRRPEDTGTDLWSTFNVAQENVIRGGLPGWVRDANNRRRRRTTREVAGIDQNRALNRALWTLAEALGRHKSAAAA